jgi:hypothetical protein
MISITTDYQQWDNTETVSVLQHRAGTSTSITGVTARRDSLSKQETGSVPSFSDYSLVYLIPAALLSVSIRPGDVITDANNKAYSVVSARTITLGNSESHYRCVCNEVIS